MAKSGNKFLLTEAIKNRSSWRSYSPGELPLKLRKEISGILSSNNKGIFGNEINFKIIEKNFLPDEKIKLGTYGFISGATSFIGSAVKPSPMIFEDYGYLLETIIIHLTGLGLATCWLGGTFTREGIRKLLGAGQDDIIPAITPVGFGTDKRSVRDRIIRMGAGSKKRKPWEEIFFDEDFNRPLNKKNAGAYSEVLEMTRISPSASNKQPWRIVKIGKFFHFFLQRTKGYAGIIKSADLQKIDMGICMANFHLSAIDLGLKGEYIIDNPGYDLPEGMEYSATWKSASR
jgi:hypothetical protein